VHHGLILQLRSVDPDHAAHVAPEELGSAVLLQTVQGLRKAVQDEFGEDADIALCGVHRGSVQLLFRLLVSPGTGLAPAPAAAAVVERMTHEESASCEPLARAVSSMQRHFGPIVAELRVGAAEQWEQLAPIDAYDTIATVEALPQLATVSAPPFSQREEWPAHCVGLRADRRWVWIQLATGRVLRFTTTATEIDRWKTRFLDEERLRVTLDVDRSATNSRILAHRVIDVQPIRPAIRPLTDALADIRSAFLTSGNEPHLWWQRQCEPEGST
jgi:hypothetical protein